MLLLAWPRPHPHPGGSVGRFPLPGVAPQRLRELGADLARGRAEETPPPSRRRQAGPELGCAPAGLGRDGGARSIGRGRRGNPPLESLTPGQGKGAGPAPPESSPPRLKPPSSSAPGFPRPPGAVPRSRVRRALPGGATPARPARSGSAYLRALGPAAEAGGKLPRPAGEHRCGRRCRLAVRVRLCVRPAGGRGPPSASCLRPERPPPSAVAGGSQVAAWPRRSQSPPSLDPRAPRHREETTTRAAARGIRSGSRARAPLRGPCSGARRGGAERTAPRLPAPREAAARTPERLPPRRRGGPFAPAARGRANTFPDHSPTSPDDRLL